MLEGIRSLLLVSRIEFLPAMASWFTIGLSWGVNPDSNPSEFVIPAALSFAVVVVSAMIGLQMNTVFDHDLDSMDNRKRSLTQALDSIGQRRLLSLVAVEFLLGLAFVYLLTQVNESLVLLYVWTLGILLAYAYSAPPLRLKSRSWLSAVTLLLVICILPALFVFYTFASEIDVFFLIFLAGQALSVYGLVLPTEIRDYVEDKMGGIETMTVRLGLTRASLLSMVFLATGGVLTGAGFLLALTLRVNPWLNLFLLSIVAADYIVLRQLKKLHSLTKEWASSGTKDPSDRRIKGLSASSPRWIAISSQSAVFMSLVLLVGKFLL